MTLKKKPFENIAGKGENGNHFFFLFPQCVLPFKQQISIFLVALVCHLQMLSVLTSPNFCRLAEFIIQQHFPHADAFFTDKPEICHL